MEKENARKQTLEQLHERRKQVVRLHKKGIKIMQIVAMTGLSYPPVRAAIDLLASFVQLLKCLLSRVLFFHERLILNSYESSYFSGPNQ